MALLAVARYTLARHLFSRWVLGYALGIALLIASLTYLSSMFAFTVELYGRLGVAIATGALMMSTMAYLVLSALLLSGDLELGVAEWFLARPLSYRQYLLGRYIGLSAALFLATLASYTASAWIFWIAGGDPRVALAMGLVNSLLAFPFTALGFALASAVGERVAALGAAFLTWLYFNILHPLTVFALVAALNLGEVATYALTAVSPVEAGRLLMYLAVDPTLSFMSPTNAAVLRLELGSWVELTPISSLVAYTAASLASSLAWGRAL